jgi:two-component system, NarL family, response regulator LiaR
MTAQKIRIFLADDHPMVRRGLVATIQGEPDMELAGEADNGLDAVRMIPACRPDVVLMDLSMPQMDGIAAITALKAAGATARFVVLTSLVDAGEIKRAIDAGASGYMLKSASGPELLTMIRSTYAGRRVMSPEATDVMIAASQERPPGTDLTQRERELLALMARGLANQQIANELGIALPTVKFHITNILGKLRAENRTDAVLIALKHKLV